MAQIDVTNISRDLRLKTASVTFWLRTDGDPDELDQHITLLLRDIDFELSFDKIVAMACEKMNAHLAPLRKDFLHYINRA